MEEDKFSSIRRVAIEEEEYRPYHKYFTRIKPRTLEIIREAKNRGIWRVSKEEGFEILRWMFGELSRTYSISVPRLVEASYEHYRILTETIGLPKVSLVSSLHEYRHHMQKYGFQRYADKEEDARGWSISAFRLALPEDFLKAWKANRIWFMPPYSPELE